ncbi:hypothetical protein [Natronorubrum sp. A-ect3]|uniref:hypothetical protein n=1 Tax=Natronorubrum sp. A-ect3 TaxID=3242698 RepID=UPI00359D374C
MTNRGDDVETDLTEQNVNKFSYDTIVPELGNKVREHVKHVTQDGRRGRWCCSL